MNNNYWCSLDTIDLRMTALLPLLSSSANATSLLETEVTGWIASETGASLIVLHTNFQTRIDTDDKETGKVR